MGKPAGVSFSGRFYDWSTIVTTGSFTLTMQGSLAGSTSAATSFTVTIARTLIVPSVATA